METEYISRNEVINRLQEIVNDYENAHDMDSFYVADYCLRHIMELSPATDVVEVVRCKDCIYKDTCEYLCSHGENWFCGDGKRRTDNGD